jgi:fatty-acyl-CoA synthase
LRTPRNATFSVAWTLRKRECEDEMNDTATPWVEGMNIGQVLSAAASRNPEGEALVFPEAGFRCTYREYDRLVDRAAAGLLALGTRPGDHIAIWATNWTQWPILQLASARLGAVLVTINPAYRPEELAYVLAQADVHTLFLIDRFKTSDYFGMLRTACPELADSAPGELRSDRFPELRWVVSLRETPAAGMISWKEMLHRGEMVDRSTLVDLASRLSPNDPINLQFTSGTTGFPKGALLSHRNLLLNAFCFAERLRATPADRICVPVPFYHCFGCVLGTLVSLISRGTMLVPSQYFDPAATLDCIEKERATMIYGVPSMFIAELGDDTFAGRNLSSLRTGIMAGSPCPVEVINRVIREMGVAKIGIGYGLTEASPGVTLTGLDDPDSWRVETVGRAFPGVEVKIVDADGREVPEGEQGELCVRGPNVMLGYYRMPAETAEAIDPEGWLHTGDLARRDENGCYRITGRIKDMIIRGGENIYPREIEECLHARPAVAEVHVVGVPDPRLGEEVCAWVKLRRGAAAAEEELRAFCREHLAHYKIPRYVLLVDEFPQTVTGKIQKYRMREEATASLGL